MITAFVCVATRSAIAGAIGLMFTLIAWLLKLWSIVIIDPSVPSIVPYTIILPIIVESSVGILTLVWLVIGLTMTFGRKTLYKPGRFGWRKGLELGIGGVVSGPFSAMGLVTVLDAAPSGIYFVFGLMVFGLLIGYKIQRGCQWLVYT